MPFMTAEEIAEMQRQTELKRQANELAKAAVAATEQQTLEVARQLRDLEETIAGRPGEVDMGVG